MPATTRMRFGAAIVSALLLGVLIGLAVHLSTPSRPTPARALTLPTFHGQGDWPPGQRPAPGFMLRDQHGRAVSLASQRGQPLLVAFLSAAPRSPTEREAVSLAQAEALLPASRRPLLDVIGLDPRNDTAAGVAAAAGRWHLSGSYRWLTGPRAALNQTFRAYGVHASHRRRAGDTGTPIYLIDRHGFERAGYLYPFFPTVLAGDLQRLDQRSGVPGG
jgi:cytochrome oxidase Cu insertion factor (SCO1/SenC/PrrC family)